MTMTIIIKKLISLDSNTHYSICDLFGTILNDNTTDDDRTVNIILNRLYNTDLYPDAKNVSFDNGVDILAYGISNGIAYPLQIGDN